MRPPSCRRWPGQRCRESCESTYSHSLLKSRRIHSAVEQYVLAGKIACVDAAHEGEGLAELLGRAESLRGNLRHGRGRECGFRLAGLLRGGYEAAAQSLGVETSRDRKSV